MVYSNKFVFCVLVNGSPQKELANGQVSLPFGTEYSLRFRNKNNRRAVVKIWIDGENVSGGGYIINAHDYIDIKRHHDMDRSFKFVSLDSEDAVDHGKNGPNNDKVKGTIEAKFSLEKEQPSVVYRDVHHHHHYDDKPKRRKYFPRQPMPIWFETENFYNKSYPSTEMGLSGFNKYQTPDEGGFDKQYEDTMLRSTKCKFKDGCTVEGSLTGQTFTSMRIELEKSETSLKLFIVGYEKAKESVSAKKVSKKKKTVKDKKILELEEENTKLKEELEKLNKAKKLAKENDDLKAKISEIKAK